jgi:hypothetical protein
VHQDHPIDHLVATVAGTPAPASVADSIQALSQHWADRRQWVLGPPELVDDLDGRGWRSLGFALPVRAARPPWRGKIDRAHLDEAKEFLGAICRVSSVQNVTFAIDFAGETIGGIEDGVMDESVERDLIGEWERVLDGHAGSPAG